MKTEARKTTANYLGKYDIRISGYAMDMFDIPYSDSSNFYKLNPSDRLEVLCKAITYILRAGSEYRGTPSYLKVTYYDCYDWLNMTIAKVLANIGPSTDLLCEDNYNLGYLRFRLKPADDGRFSLFSKN